MRRGLILGAATAAALAGAHAADYPPRRPGPLYADPAAAQLFDWSGFYLGGHVGYGWASAVGVDASGFLGGFQGGYNFLYTNGVLLGLEADLTLSAIEGSTGGVTVRNEYMGTIRGRLGFAVDRMLFYGTAGWGMGRGVVSIGGATDHRTHSGWALGLGAEAGITPNITARIEYLRLNLGSQTYATVVGPMRTDFDTNILRMGMNYKF
jgi:outer membrane immunogenic protein